MTITRKNYDKIKGLIKLNKKSKKLLHGHLDFKSVPTLEDLVIIEKVGFTPSSFINYPHLRPNRPSYEPIDLSGNGEVFHFTKETFDPVELLESILILENHFSKSDARMYAEMEIVQRIHLDKLNINEFVLNPIFIETKTIKIEDRNLFRQTELHAYANRNTSDEKVMEMICDMGLYEAYCQNNSGGIEAIFTIQGLQKEIRQIQKHLTLFMGYFSKLGLLKEAYIEKEDAIGWFLCNIDVEQLPPLAYKISKVNE